MSATIHYVQTLAAYLRYSAQEVVAGWVLTGFHRQMYRPIHRATILQRVRQAKVRLPQPAPQIQIVPLSLPLRLRRRQARLVRVLLSSPSQTLAQPLPGIQMMEVVAGFAGTLRAGYL